MADTVHVRAIKRLVAKFGSTGSLVDKNKGHFKLIKFNIFCCLSRVVITLIYVRVYFQGIKKYITGCPILIFPLRYFKTGVLKYPVFPKIWHHVVLKIRKFGN